VKEEWYEVKGEI